METMNKNSSDTEEPQGQTLEDLEKRFEDYQGEQVAPTKHSETLARHWIIKTKMILSTLGVAETKRFVDKAAAEVNHASIKDGNKMVQASLKPQNREQGKTKEELQEALAPEDEDDLHKIENIFFKEGSVDE